MIRSGNGEWRKFAASAGILLPNWQPVAKQSSEPKTRKLAQKFPSPNAKKKPGQPIARSIAVHFKTPTHSLE